MDEGDLYIGSWRLIPELCLYQAGEVPLSGLYEIAENHGAVEVSIWWQETDGSERNVTFSGVPDGSHLPSDGPGVSEFSLTRVSEAILDSSAFAGGEEVAYARRAVSADGLLLSTVQRGRTPQGEPFSNFQVYRREESLGREGQPEKVT